MKSETFLNKTIRYPENTPEELLEKYKKFINYFCHYLDRLSLHNWHIEFELHENSMPENKASVAYYFEGCTATCIVQASLLENHPDIEIKRCAFHEVCELLLADIGAYLESMFAEHFVAKQIHNVIRRLENLEFGTSGFSCTV